MINIDGDGCFQMTMQELATARCTASRAIHVVVNNGWLGMVRQWQELFHSERFSETQPDGRPARLREARRELRRRRLPLRDDGGGRRRHPRARSRAAAPAVIDARVDREEKVYPMVPAGGSATDIIDVEWAEDDNQWVEEGV